MSETELPASAEARRPTPFPRLPDSPIIQAIVLGAFAGALFFFHLGTYGLWEPDESRYAEIAREMFLSGNLIVPHLNYVAYIEKPPLLYWLGALWMALFGVNEFAARFTSALAALSGVIATWFFARRTLGSARGLLAGAILATSALYAEMAQALTTDMLLTALVTIALFAFFLHWREGGRWCWTAYLATALGVLAKGPVAVAIPVLAMAAFLWWEGELRGAIARFHAIAGAVIVVAIAAPWFIAISLREPGFVDFYFIGEHIRRFFQSSYSHGGPAYYYVPVILGGMLPWTLFAPFISWREIVRTASGRFCCIGSIVIVALFSAASAKLIPYVLPAFPLFAVVIADGVATRVRQIRADTAGAPGGFAAAAAVLAILGAGALGAALLAAHLRTPYAIFGRRAIGAIGIVGMIGGITASALFIRRRIEAAFAVVIAATALALIAGSYVRLELEPLRSYADLAHAIADKAPPDARIVCYPRYVQALPFYTGRRIILVGPPTELAFGAAHAPDAGQYFFHSLADAMRLWNAPGPVVLVIDVWDLDRLRGSLGDFTVIGSEWQKRAVLKNREPR